MTSNMKHKDIDTIIFTRGKRGFNSKLQPDHYHPFYELIHVNSGSLRFLLKDTLYNLDKGDILLIAPRELHHSQYYADVNCDLTFIYFKPEHLQQEIRSVFRAARPNGVTSYVGTVPHIYQDELNRLFNRLQTECNSIDELSPHFMSLQLSEILLFFMRHSILDCQELDISTAKEADILLATKYIYQNYKKPLTLEELASVSSLSPTYFSKKFKQVTGMGFKEYLNFIRLKNAATALYSTDSTITDIALEYGFSDSNYFKDLFKKEYGMSPREYRKSRGY
ncbi:MAG: helix-turn-helix transcriptional regulator [Lachnospiraceae bacterium]|nr:helix-turn-helix transcriptional regulator [Lachnospiraceae bacterium]